MGVKWKTTKDYLPQIQNTLDSLKGKTVTVGALRGDHAWLAGIHEYGCTIKPKRAQYLTVPVHPKAAGKKASEFNDLWTLKAASGELFLCRNVGKDKFEVLYWLTKSVKIPERSFLRNGHDENAERIITQTERMISLVLDGKKTVDDVYDAYGQQMATAIKKYMRDLRTPPNSWATQETKGDDNPLIGKTNGLMESITWEVD